MGSKEFIAVLDEDNDVLEVNQDGSINVEGIDAKLSDSLRGREDSATFNGTIVSGGTETLTVTTEKSDMVAIFIDDGTTDNKSSKYDMEQRVFKDAFNDYQFYDSVKDEDSRSWIDPTFGSKFQIDVTNVSGTDDTFRISMESYREMN